MMTRTIAPPISILPYQGAKHRRWARSAEAQFGLREAQFGLREAQFGLREAQFGLREAQFGGKVFG